MVDDDGGISELAERRYTNGVNPPTPSHARPPAPQGSGGKPKIAALAPWFGSNRIGAARVGEALAGCEWVGVPFVGGCCEIPEIAARTIVGNDMHGDLINLASVVADPESFAEMQRIAERQLLHPDTLAACQYVCDQFRKGYRAKGPLPIDVEWAAAYFAVAWMTRSGTAGTKGELTGKLCLRWESGGGDSAIRYRNAVASLPAWHQTLKRCTFSRLDYVDFLAKCKDRPRHGIYCDPPFPCGGEKYSHAFTETDHLILSARLDEFTAARVVVRYYDHPLIRDLYREADGWRWIKWTGRKQTNGDAPEVLIVKR